MRSIKIPEFKDSIEAIRWILLVTMLPFILYMFLTDEPLKQVQAKEIHEKKYNDSYSGRISEKEHDGNRWYRFYLSTGRYIYVDKTAYDAAETGDTLWKKSKQNITFIKMPDGLVIGFKEVSEYKNEYINEKKNYKSR